MSNTNPETAISPKVIAGAIGAIIGAGISAGVAALTPDLFESLGAWSGVIFAVVSATGSALAGYLVRDPLRTGSKFQINPGPNGEGLTTGYGDPDSGYNTP